VFKLRYNSGVPDEVYFDPYDVEINADPYPVYQRLREEAPAYHNERYDFWALSRFDDVEKAHLNWQVFSSTRSDILDIIKSGVKLPPGVILFEDPPIHTMHRGLMSRVFTPRRMAALEDQVRDYCARCLDPLVGSQGFDIVTELAAQLPMRVIGMLLGIPEEDQVAVRDKTDRDLRTRPGQPMKVREGTVANGEMFAEYIEWRSKHPSDDLMTKLLNAEFTDERGESRKLTREEVLTYTTVLAGAGNETTGRLIGWLAKLLAEHPDQRREVVEDPSLVPRVIDEALRFEPTGHASARYVTQDVEYHGRTIPAGSALLMLMASANRDPRRYDNPDVFDIHRQDIQHLTFGFGPHYCLGANLSRLEGRVALEELLKRFPEWDVDYGGMKLAPTTTVRGWEHMPIVLP
jgi:cytochrome P450